MLDGVVLFKSLTMTYSHMGKPHTTIGDTAFHFWVRNGFRWFHSSMVVKQTGFSNIVVLRSLQQVEEKVGYMSYFIGFSYEPAVLCL